MTGDGTHDGTHDGAPFDEEALVRALRAPGSEAELGEQERYAAMFRDAQGDGTTAPVQLARRRSARLAGRFGAGSALVVALAAGGGGVAAAYTGNLPDPIQDFVHRTLGPVGPPAAKHRPQRTTTAAPPSHSASPSPTLAATPSTSASPSTSPTHTPSPTHAPTRHPSPSATASATAAASPTPTSTPTSTPTASAVPTPTPSSTPTPTATPTPTSAPSSPPVVTPPVAAAVSISGSTHRVDVGESVAFSGVVSGSDGTPLRRARVTLQRLEGGHWVAVASGRTDTAGQVTLTLPPVAATTGVRFHSGRVHSPRWKVELHPELTVTSAAGTTPGTVVIAAVAVGAQPGDTVLLLSKAGQVAAGTLAPDGSVSFTVTPAQRKTRYAVVVPRTPAHTLDHASITVIAKLAHSSSG